MITATENHCSVRVNGMDRRLLCFAVFSMCMAASPAVHAAAQALPSSQVAWLQAAGDGDIERAFAQARTERKPLLLYWGAKWCPPCNQLKATLFNRQDFIERSRSFVAVSIDGDLPGAQALGARFKVIGYPTMILFTPAGAEITRLPGEADAPQVMRVLQLGLTGGRPVKAVLADARSGRALPANDWRMLAFYSWETDEQQLVAESGRSQLLASLAAASRSGDPEIATRLWLKALAANEDGKGVKPDAALHERVRGVLGSVAATRLHMDVLTNGAATIVKTLAPRAGPSRGALLASFDAALTRLQADRTLSRADRLGALLARVDLARLDQPKDAPRPKLPPALLEDVREHARRADREITDGYERQAVITTAAHVLGRAGLWQESDGLLKGNLAKSHSPYYLMSQLAGNARTRGDKAEALRWYAEAFNASEGPATRLQWGASYLAALVDLTPKDAKRIEQTASQIFRNAAAQPNPFHQRSARSLRRVGEKLASWSERGVHGDVIKRLQSELEPVCARLATADGQRAACEGLLKPAA